MKKLFRMKKFIFAAMAAAAISMPAVQMAAPMAVYAEESYTPGPNILGKYTDRNRPGAEIEITFFGDNYVFKITSPQDQDGNQHQWAFSGAYDAENNVINYSYGVRYHINNDKGEFELEADGLAGSVVNKDGVLFWNPEGEIFEQGIWDRIPGTAEFIVKAEVYYSKYDYEKKHGTVTPDIVRAYGGENVKFDVAIDEGYKIVGIYAYDSKNSPVKVIPDPFVTPDKASFTITMPEDDVNFYVAIEKEKPEIPDMAGGYDARENNKVHMDLYKNSDGTFYAQIEMPEDDVKSLRWTFSGTYDPVIGTLRYEDGKKHRFDTGNFSETSELIYENGTGSLVYKEGTLFWNPDKEQNLTFDRAEDEYSVKTAVAPDREDRKEHGAITMDEKYLKTKHGEKVTVTGVPDEGYRLVDIAVEDADGNNIETTKVDESSYSFIMPAKDVIATAVFAKDNEEVELTGAWANRENSKHLMFIEKNESGAYDVLCIVPRTDSEATFYKFSGEYNPELKRLGFESSLTSQFIIDENGNITESQSEKTGGGALIYKDGIIFLNINDAPEDKDPIQFVRIDKAYNINTAATEHGKVTVNRTSAVPGARIVIKTEPEEGFATHHVSVLDKDGKEVELKKLGTNVYVFDMIDGDVTVSATFVDSGAKPVPVNPAPGYNGGASAVVTKGVNTGDTNMLPLWVSLAAASAGVAVTMIALKRKRG